MDIDMNIEYFENDPNDKMPEIKINMLLMTIVIIGALNWGFTAFGLNLVQLLSELINRQFGSSVPIDKIIYLSVALCAIILAFNRNTWLPFLGKTIIPEPLVPLRTPVNPNKKIQIKTIPNTKIIYWAAINKDKDNKQDYKLAYGNYSNSGVAMSDSNGDAELVFTEGSGYTVPSGKMLKRHVHYRVMLSNAVMGQVNTIEY
jgi:uncharacterized membrane protein YuzA (DUF378 family)